MVEPGETAMVRSSSGLTKRTLGTASVLLDRVTGERRGHRLVHHALHQGLACMFERLEGVLDGVAVIAVGHPADPVSGLQHRAVLLLGEELTEVRQLLLEV